jgi:Mg2+ and Co2+ transporter CorA
MQEFIGTVFDLIKILEKQVYQLDYMQSSSMDMMNKIKRIQKNVVKVRRDSDEDDD